MQTLWSCLELFQGVDRLTEMSFVPTVMNKNVTVDITQQSWSCQFTHVCHDVLYLSKIKWRWWLRHGCWWPPRIAKLPALILDPHQQKWHFLHVCVGDPQKNTISYLHLSRLIILWSISFKQEASHFSCSSSQLQNSQAMLLSSLSVTTHTYFAPYFNSQS